MAEENQGFGGLSLADLLKGGLSFFSGGFPGLATSSAASPLWSEADEELGTEEGTSRSLASLLLGLTSGAGIPGLIGPAWQLAKKYSTETQPRWWDTPAEGPHGLFEFGRSDPEAYSAGLPEYAAQPWSPGMNPASYNRGDVGVGPGSDWAVNNVLMNQPSGFELRGGPQIARKFGRGGSRVSGRPLGPMGGARPSGQFQQAREKLGMPASPDFDRLRQLLMG